MGDAVIEIKNLSLSYKSENTTYEALRNINLTINRGEFICIVGSSGCGKSTLLSVLEGLNLPTSGSVKINGQEVTGPGVERAVVFQSYSLFPWMTALENVAFAVRENSRKTTKITKRESFDIARTFLSRVDLTAFEDKLPGELSGGMQQRVAIARAMACNPEILLMDEPFGALDTKIRDNLQGLILKLWGEEEKKKTVVFVTHDLNEAVLLADRIVFMIPKQIYSIVDINLPRPHSHPSVKESPEYKELYQKLLRLFYNDSIELIYDEGANI